MSAEQWLPVPGFEGFYEVSDLGRVWSVGRWCRHPFGDGRRWVKPAPRAPGVGRGGYLIVTLHRDGVRSTHYIAVLVLRAFVGERPSPGHDACHGDGVRTDNALTNLRWDTKSANQFDAVRHGTHTETRKTRCPLDHRLEAPNLREWDLRTNGARACLACGRAHATVSNARRRGAVVDFATAANEHYRRIAPHWIASCA